jgi:predicted phosphoribosyltransferase
MRARPATRPARRARAVDERAFSVEHGMYFKDRRDAGKRLAGKLAGYRDSGALVLALPRGGVPVACEIARALSLPLDLMLVRKLGVPGHEELAMGAIANDNVEVLNDSVLRSLAIPPEVVARVAERERVELERRNLAYRAGKPPPALAGRVVILVDDGVATGADMRAAAEAAARQAAAKIVVAVPVASSDAVRMLREVADEVVCLATPEPFGGVGLYYADFSQTPDAEVKRLLAEASPPVA